jgi:hypothetical protein
MQHIRLQYLRVYWQREWNLFARDLKVSEKKEEIKLRESMDQYD